MVLFSDHWIKVVKKWTSPLVVRLVVPLALASWSLFSHLTLVTLVIQWVQWGELFAFYWVSAHLRPFPLQFTLIAAAFITLMTMIPTLFYWCTAKPFRLFKPPYWSSIYIWVVLILLLVIPYG